MRRVSTAPRGTTLVEVVVVCFLICMAIGVIVPGMLASTHAQQRTRCLNNMRQLALAIVNYEQEYRVLPPGTIDYEGPIRNRPEGIHTGWIVQLLPFMEQSGLAKSIDADSSIYSPVNQKTSSMPLNSLICGADKNPARARGVAVSSYAACHHDVEAPIDVDNHGVFFLNSRTTYEDISDGTSNTIYFAEKRSNPSDLGWGSGTNSTLRNTGTPLNGDFPAGADPVGGFGSFHPGGANIGFGDGSVRFVTDTIRFDLYQLLGHRADGELVGGDAF